MGTTTLTENKWRVTPLLAASSLIAIASSANASSWEFTPSLSINQDYTDNLELTNSNEEESFITQIRPGFTLSKEGGRIQASVNYGLQKVEYSSDQGNDTHNHQLGASAKAELIENHLFVDLNGSISQELGSNRDADAGNNLNNAGSRSDTTTFGISPYWQQRIGDDTTAGVRLTYSEVNFDDPATTDTSGTDISFFTNTESSGSKLHWGVNFDGNQSERTSSIDDKSESVSVSLGYRSSSQLDTTFTYGYVDNHVDNPTDSQVDTGDFWGVNVDWAPNPRTDINVSYNSRLQAANDYGLRFNYRRKHSTWSINYTESLTSVRQQLLNSVQIGSLICDPNGTNCTFVTENNPIVPPGQIEFSVNTPIATLTNDRFIQKSLTGNVVISRGKSSYVVGFYTREREYQSGSQAKEEDIGVNLNWSISLNSLTSLSLGYSWSELEPEGEAKDTVNQFTLNLSRRLTPETSVSMVLNANDRSSDDSSREFTENSIGIGLVRTF